MKYLIGFLLRITVVVLFVLWLMEAPGTAEITWHDMVINTSAAMLVAGAAALIYLAILLHRLWRFLWDGPRIWKLNRKIKRSDDGQIEVAKGLSALAASNPAQAKAHAVRAKRYLGATPQILLMEAQAAQLAGDHETARKLFQAMADQPETAILGYRGLIMAALRFQDYEEALVLATKLEKEKGDVPWLHKLRFQISANQENWPLALTSLKQARKTRAVNSDEADQSESALLLARTKELLRASETKQALIMAKKAHSLTPNWIPALLILVEVQIVTGHARAARRLIQKTWRRMPHPQFLSLFYWASKPDKPIKGFKLIQKMVRSKADDPVSLMAIAEAALKADLWGEARHALLNVEARGFATHSTYEMLARLERQETKDEYAATAWLAKAASAPLDPAWLCASCGQTHSDWDASCSSCSAFNRIEWATPGQAHEKTQNKESIYLMEDIK